MGGVGSLPDCVPVGHRAPEGDPHRDKVAADPRTENDQIKMYECVFVCVSVCVCMSMRLQPHRST